MDFSRLTNPQAYKDALAGLLRRGGEVTDFIATAPEKAGQAILEGHEKNKALQAQAFANPDRPFQVTNKQAMGELGDRMLAGPLSVAPVGMIAYHGTPHTILDKFDINKVGTGEGAQAYGHGMYFAENPTVATQYKSSTIPENALTDPQKNVVEWAKYEAGDEGPLAHLLDMQQLYTKKYGKENVDKAVEFFKGGNLYKVDIPDEYIPKMLDYDKPLSQQPKSVQDILKTINPNFKDSMVGREILESLSKPSKMDKNSPMWQVLKDNPNMTPQEAFSKYANEQGIKGIRYLDEGSRSQGGTSNFVVFDPTDVKILERNNQPISRKELLQQQIDKIE